MATTKRHLLVRDTTGCGRSAKRLAFTIDPILVTCPECRAAASAWRQNAAEAVVRAFSAVQVVYGAIITGNAGPAKAALVRGLLCNMAGDWTGSKGA